MNIEHLHEILLLSEHLSFSKAASKLYMTQSCLSRHVSAVEKELGVAIFKRDTTGVKLTEAGRVLIDGFKTANSAISNAVKTAKTAEQTTKSINISGCLSNDYSAVLLSESISRLSSLGKSATLHLIDIRTKDYTELLLEDVCDIAIAPRYTTDDERLVFHHLVQVPFAITCDKQHPLASKNPLLINDVIPYPIYTYPLQDRSEYHTYVNQILRREQQQIELRFISDTELPLIGNPASDILFGLSCPYVAKQSCNLVTKSIPTLQPFDFCIVTTRKKWTNKVIAEAIAIILEAAKTSWVQDRWTEFKQS